MTLAIQLKETSKGTFVLQALHQGRDVTQEATWSTSNSQVLRLDPTRPGVVGAGVQGGGTVTARLGESEDTWLIDHWDGVLTHLGPPNADCPDYLVVGIECRMWVPIDSSPTNSYDGHELIVTAEPADVAQVIQAPPHWRLRALRPGRVTVRATYGHAVSERTYDVQEEALVLKDISVQDSNSSLHRLWLDENVEVWTTLTNQSDRFVFEGMNVRWSSTDERVLGIDVSTYCPMLIPRAEGRAQVIAEWRDVRRTADILVAERPKIEWI